MIKGGHADVIPIATKLVPYLEDRVAQSPADLVFPAPDGSMMPEGVQLELVLRRALHKAGIVEMLASRAVFFAPSFGYVERTAPDQRRLCTGSGYRSSRAQRKPPRPSQVLSARAQAGCGNGS